MTAAGAAGAPLEIAAGSLAGAAFTGVAFTGANCVAAGSAEVAAMAAR